MHKYASTQRTLTIHGILTKRGIRRQAGPCRYNSDRDLHKSVSIKKFRHHFLCPKMLKYCSVCAIPGKSISLKIPVGLPHPKGDRNGPCTRYESNRRDRISPHTKSCDCYLIRSDKSTQSYDNQVYKIYQQFTRIDPFQPDESVPQTETMSPLPIKAKPANRRASGSDQPPSDPKLRRKSTTLTNPVKLVIL